MSYYVTPRGEQKETFLAREGVVVPRTITMDQVPAKSCLVVLMDNGPFTAANVVRDARDLESNTQPSDFRRKTFYVVPTAKLLGVVPHPTFEEFARTRM